MSARSRKSFINQGFQAQENTEAVGQFMSKNPNHSRPSRPKRTISAEEQQDEIVAQLGDVEDCYQHPRHVKAN